MSLTVASLIDVLERRYPPDTAQDWDAVGLVVGDRTAPVDRVLYTVDVTAAVVQQARDLGAQLIIAHHPLLLRGIHAIDLDHPKGKMISDLIRNEIALYVAHTNADIPAGGTVDALAATIGLQDCRPLVPLPQSLDKIITFVPQEDEQRLIDALAAAGAGAIGSYDRCAFSTPGTGTFRPLTGSTPYLGEVDRIEVVPEARIEMVLRRDHRGAVLQALRSAHPYETPAFDVVELANGAGDAGLGRVGLLPAPLSLRDFADRLAQVLPATATGVRVAGDLAREVTTVAVQAGAGDDLLDTARKTGADVYVTSDLRHHPASEATAWADAPALIDIAHWAAEWTWLPVVRRLVDEELAKAGQHVEAEVSQICTDPWTSVTRG